MSNGIGKKQLELAVERLNIATDNPIDAYVKGDDGKYHAQVGNYHIDYSYGGCRLVQMMNDKGGIRDVQMYLGSKRDCYRGIHTALEIIR